MAETEIETPSRAAQASSPTSIPPTDAAEEVLAAYEGWMERFREMTRRARVRFLNREWRESQVDAAARMDLYPAAVAAAVDTLRAAGVDGADARDRFAALIGGRADAELAETFYNSVMRRVLTIVGVDPATEFTAAGDGLTQADAVQPLHRSFEGGLTGQTVAALFRATELADAFAELEGDAEACARAAREQLGADADRVRGADLLPFLFYRNKAAYMVARLRLEDGEVRPLLVPLVNGPRGVRPDAVLTTPDEVHVVFSFARSYFHADTGRPAAAIAFLHTLMPAKPLNELYTSLGHNKHGKTELYRELVRQLSRGDARFERAEGIRGLVMSVFTLPGYPVVFKVIRDEFGASKNVTRDAVKEKYRLVFRMDRVGRLVDAQEFEELAFPRDRFDPAWLEELRRDAPSAIRDDGRRVVVRHLYTERRLRPLDLYLRESDDEVARAAVVEYGNAIKDLACANIFPGDLLLKNFGVSRHGRVIFYDYDELALLTDVRFRAMPTARYEEDEMAADPWFSVNDGDVFPEEFVPFLVPAGPLREAFMDAHRDLFTVRWWREIQERQAAGEIPDFFPYPQTRRLKLD
ncbi:MAG TPA: bifunctional isocitrate dehydrogenase kinase/phosphatase [Longimicrobium sp.]|nr:bifunctional isocitrate dehydrogenase kinase/phosphatase [Longimicrobium sp.]